MFVFFTRAFCKKSEKSCKNNPREKKKKKAKVIFHQYIKDYLAYIFHRYGKEEVCSWFFEVFIKFDAFSKFLQRHTAKNTSIPSAKQRAICRKKQANLQHFFSITFAAIVSFGTHEPHFSSSGSPKQAILQRKCQNTPLKIIKSQKKRVNEAKKRENSKRGRKFSKRIAVFLLYFCDFTAYFSHFSKYFPPYSPILRVFTHFIPTFSFVFSGIYQHVLSPSAKRCDISASTQV